MKPLESFTLADLRNDMQECRPDLANLANSILAKTHEEFIRVLYSDIDTCIGLMEQDPSVRKNDGEDRLTEDLKVGLIMRGYQVSHDEKIGGHADLVVRHRNLAYIWLGEAKIHDSDYDYLLQGFQQLCTRYAPGTPGTNQGGMIIYIRQAKAALIIGRWRDYLQTLSLDDYSDNDCSSRSGLAFFSTHTHESSGLPYTVRHMAVVLHFDPKDRR